MGREPRDLLDELGDVPASEAGGHPLLAHRGFRAAHHLADRIDQQGVDQAAEFRDSAQLQRELRLTGTFERPGRRRSPHQIRSLREQVLQGCGEEVHSRILRRGSDIQSRKSAGPEGNAVAVG
ncbi:hypothetical protein FVP74_00950 [Microbacterium saccharophilum]|uniref:Uncharacterized protein n=1 Tax=Microbacterium saccharophilum TaxID=1213358 RepID=A0A5C8I9R0_9MICO|nr:hypothetical protein FVP74_00950 [Microbacterium saccharophilum]